MTPLQKCAHAFELFRIFSIALAWTAPAGCLRIGDRDHVNSASASGSKD